MILTTVDGNFIFRGPLNIFFGETHKHFRFLIADLFNLAGWDQDFLTRIPVAGFDNEIADRPTLFIDNEISDLTDLPVARLNMIAANGLSAAEMFVFPVFMFLVGLYPIHQKGQGNRNRADARHPAAIPVRRPAVIAVILDLELTGNRFVRFDRRTVFNLFFVQLYVKCFLGLVQFPECMGGEENEASRQP